MKLSTYDLNLIGTGRSVCAPDPSFVMFQVLANQYSVPFRALHSILSSILTSMDGWTASEMDPALIFVPQPNNQLGIYFPEIGSRRLWSQRRR